MKLKTLCDVLVSQSEEGESLRDELGHGLIVTCNGDHSRLVSTFGVAVSAWLGIEKQKEYSCLLTNCLFNSIGAVP